tara:strand:+ start:258 stop:467 length:210 start_codon:yes stop_codon:yes gene_type:complete
MILRMASIDFNTANIVVDFGDDCYGVYHSETGYVGVYAKDEDELLQISDKLIKNPNKTPEEIARDIWGK